MCQCWFWFWFWFWFVVPVPAVAAAVRILCSQLGIAILAAVRRDSPDKGLSGEFAILRITLAGFTHRAHTARAPRNALEQIYWAKGHSLVPWLLHAQVLPTLGGEDDGGRHRITI